MRISTSKTVTVWSSMTTRIGPIKPPRALIREWINESGLDQQVIADRMGCTPGTLSKLINGGMKRTDEWLARITHALDIKFLDIYRDPKRPEPEDLLRDVPDKKREAIIEVIKILVRKPV